MDIVLLTKTDLYLLELKLNQSAQAAMQQINLKNYRQRFALSGKPITKVGINFDSTQGNVCLSSSVRMLPCNFKRFVVTLQASIPTFRYLHVKNIGSLARVKF